MIDQHTLLSEKLIYQGKNGEILLKEDINNETIWASLNQIAELFSRDKSVISRHIKNIFNSGELNEKQTVAIFATVKKEGEKDVKRNIEYYNLDMMISIGYRVDSFQATEFRKWATKILKQHITNGFTINKKILEKNKEEFLKVINDLKLITTNKKLVNSEDILELVKSFANTWFNLESYDKDKLPLEGFTTKDLKLNSDELYKDIEELKQDLISKGEATKLFAQEKNNKSLEGILGNIYQSFDSKDLYPSTEEKASHLLYFIVKNHPFTDGNKRSGAFAFIWFLNKIGFEFREKINPETLTVITLLVAESNPKDKDKIIGLIILLLKK